MPFYTYTYPLSPAEKRAKHELDALCDPLVAELSKLAIDGRGTNANDLAAVVDIFEAQPRNTPTRRQRLASAFWSLDEKPHQHGNLQHWQPWHSLLRSCRNHPDYGPRLFATWS